MIMHDHLSRLGSLSLMIPPLSLDPPFSPLNYLASLLCLRHDSLNFGLNTQFKDLYLCTLKECGDMIGSSIAYGQPALTSVAMSQRDLFLLIQGYNHVVIGSMTSPSWSCQRQFAHCLEAFTPATTLSHRSR